MNILQKTLKELQIKPCQRNINTFDDWMRNTIHNVHWIGLTNNEFDIIIKKFE